MHEFSLASSIADIVLAEARQRRAVSVTNITLRIGPIQQVVPEILQSAFEATVQSTPLENARLSIVFTPLTLRCDDCDQSSDINEFQLICPRCNSTHVDIVGGDELVISEIEMEVRDECPSDAQRV